ncbi:MAG: DUF624 domain-containing protein [Clostridia bacterium]|nr:DUF624 domain-containing protein [Clostridia bacterium]
MNRDGKGVYEEENRKPTFLFFFKLLWRKFSQLVRLNLMLLVQVIPIIVFLYVYFAGTKTPTATELVYAPLYGISKITQSPSLTALLDIRSIQMGLPIFSPAVIITLICLAVLLAVTFGWINTGAAYVLRGLFRGDPVFIWSDFFYAIKRNFKQAFFMGLLDFVCIVVLVVDFVFFYNRTGSYLDDVMYFMIFAIAIIYIVMRFYMYLLMITFDLKTFKILKNSLIFTVLGIKRNIIALLGLVAVIVLNILIIVMFLSIGVSIPLVLPFFYVMALMGFISTYAAYPVIDKYMIAPYANENSIEAVDDTDTVEDIEE